MATPGPSKKLHVPRNLKEKQEIIIFVEQNPGMTCTEVAEKFSLLYLELYHAQMRLRNGSMRGRLVQD